MPKPLSTKDAFIEALLSGFSAKLARLTETLPSTRCIARPELIGLLGDIRDELDFPGYRSASADALLGLIERSSLIKPIEITPLSPRVKENRLYAIGLDVDPNLVEPAELLQAHIPDGVICYFTALQLHGLTTQPAPHHHIAKVRPATVREGSKASIVTVGKNPPPLGNGQFIYQGVTYFVTARDFTILRRSQQQYLNGRSRIHVTTLEQTLVDTLHRPMSAGGPSVVFEAWETASGMADMAGVMDITLQINDPLLARRVGFMLEQVSDKVAATKIDALRTLADTEITTDTGELFSLITTMPYKTFNNRWKILVP